MSVKIRLARIGTKNAPVYRIVAIDTRDKRDGKALEILGTYHPRLKTFDKFHDERIEAWLEKGATMTDSAKKLRKMYRTKIEQQ